jgi:hypothetical protein
MDSEDVTEMINLFNICNPLLRMSQDIVIQRLYWPSIKGLINISFLKTFILLHKTSHLSQAHQRSNKDISNNNLTQRNPDYQDTISYTANHKCPSLNDVSAAEPWNTFSIVMYVRLAKIV